jgi:hypothetical protein
MYINEEKKRYDIRNDKERLPGLYVSHRQFSWLTATLIALTFCVFVGGYLLGKRKQMSPDAVSTSELVVVAPTTPHQEASAEHTAMVPARAPSQTYYAQLIGFGTSSAAQKFSEKLQRRNYPVCVRERHSTTAQGKKIIWYQVITEPFEDKNELLAAIQKIKKEEKLHDIRIINC